MRRRRRRERGGADGSRRDGQSADPPIQLTETGLANLEEAERIAARVENRWAERVRRAPGGEAGEARFHGLRSWLREATAALAAKLDQPPAELRADRARGGVGGLPERPAAAQSA